LPDERCDLTGNKSSTPWYLGKPPLHTSAVTAGKLTMMKNTVDPMATQSGMLAALLAENGYTGPRASSTARRAWFTATAPSGS